MANKSYFKPNSQGIRACLQSDYMLSMTERYANSRVGSEGETKPFIGFDRAKTIITTKEK